MAKKRKAPKRQPRQLLTDEELQFWSILHYAPTIHLFKETFLPTKKITVPTGRTSSFRTNKGRYVQVQVVEQVDVATTTVPFWFVEWFLKHSDLKIHSVPLKWMSSSSDVKRIREERELIGYAVRELFIHYADRKIEPWVPRPDIDDAAIALLDAAIELVGMCEKSSYEKKGILSDFVNKAFFSLGSVPAADVFLHHQRFLVRVVEEVLLRDLKGEPFDRLIDLHSYVVHRGVVRSRDLNVRSRETKFHELGHYHKKRRLPQRSQR